MKIMSKKVTIFTPNRDNIQDVINSIEKLIDEIEKKNEIEISFNIFTPNTSYFSQVEFLISVHRDDVVIVDASIPSKLTKETVSIYPILTAQVNCLDHVLVFSKEQNENGFEILPLNISPLRQRKQEELLPWLNTQITDIMLASKYPYERLPINSLTELSERRVEMEEMISKSLDAKKKRIITGAKRVMISYRNSYSKEVKTLTTSFNPDYDVEYTVLPPGSLCGDYEAHTPMRRWMLVGLLEDTIRDVDEVWVYKTNNYTHSWWTLAEMVMVANVNCTTRKTNPIKIKVYDPTTKQLYDGTESSMNGELRNFITSIQVKLSDEQVKRLARYLSNTRPDTMGPEVMQQKEQMQTMASLLKHTPSFLKKKMLSGIEDVIKQGIPTTLSEEEQQQMLDEMMKMYRDPNEFEKYLNDDVFKEDFWHTISYQTDEQTKAFANNHIDVDAFMEVPMAELTHFSDVELKQNKEKAITINRKGKVYTYTKEVGTIRYLWLATRMGMPTVKDAPGLEVIQTYNLLTHNQIVGIAMKKLL